MNTNLGNIFLLFFVNIDGYVRGGCEKSRCKNT